MTPEMNPKGYRHAMFAGFAGSLVGIGLARFAYTPLIPVLIEAGWFAPSDVVYLGAANLAGYLAGALAARTMAAKFSARLVLRAVMLLAAVAFFACAVPISFSWYFIWRFLSGLAGGAVMVLAASTILPNVPVHRRGLAGGIIFTGVGLGIALSGTLVPILLIFGLTGTWIGLGVISLVLTLAAWSGWPTDAPGVKSSQPVPMSNAFANRFLALYVVYALVAVGMVPHMVFLVDYVTRGLGQGFHAGAVQWIVFGIGAVSGALITGRMADRFGFRTALRFWLVVEAAAVAATAFISGGSLYATSFIAGLFVPGMVPLVVGYTLDLAGGDAALHRAAWSYATTAFALGQAAAAYGFSYLFERTGSYVSLFELAGAALAIALVIDFIASAWAREPEKSKQ